MTGIVVVIAALMLTAAGAEAQFPQPIQAAIAHLAQNLGITQDEVRVAGLEEVTWPDTSLGNPQPGQTYAQVLTPGYRVTLEALGERYLYHTDMGTRAVPTTAIGEPQEHAEVADLLELSALAREHLAASLGIDSHQVFLASVEETTWPDLSLGRPQPGQSYARVETPGYRLVLEYEGGIETYHADLTGRIVAPDGSTIVTAAETETTERPAFVEEAIQNLARRHNMTPDAIAVVSVEETQWPDGARGLPDPGMMYTQAIVPGHRIVLAVGERRFAYHASRGEVRYADIIWDDDAQVSLLTLQQADQSDGNNLHHLQRTDTRTGEAEIVAEHISSFVATPDGKTVVLKTRTSRSAHSLEVLEADGSRMEVATALDFTRMAIRPDGQVLAAWQRQMVGEKSLLLHIYWRPWHPESVMQVELPGVDADTKAQMRLVWTSEGLAASVISDEGPQSFYVKADGEIEALGAYEVLGWIPRTRSLLVTGETDDGSQQLSALMPGQEHVVQLVSAAKVLAAAAPFDGRYIVAALDDGAGRVSVQRIDWGGSTMPMKEYSQIDQLSLSVAPVGDVVAVTAHGGTMATTEVLDMPALTTLLTVEEPGLAQLVSD